MKKFIIPIIIAAALGVGGAVTAVALNRHADAEQDYIDYSVPELTYGKYYLDGNVDSGLWLELTPEHIELCGNDLKGSFFSAVENREGLTGSDADTRSETLMSEYCKENPYVVTHSFRDGSCGILIDWSTVDEEQHRYNGTGYTYFSDSETLNFALFGDFILVE